MKPQSHCVLMTKIAVNDFLHQSVRVFDELSELTGKSPKIILMTPEDYEIISRRFTLTKANRDQPRIYGVPFQPCGALPEGMVLYVGPPSETEVQPRSSSSRVIAPIVASIPEQPNLRDHLLKTFFKVNTKGQPFRDWIATHYEHLSHYQPSFKKLTGVVI